MREGSTSSTIRLSLMARKDSSRISRIQRLRLGQSEALVLAGEVARLKGQLLPEAPASPRERDNQRSIWIELDRVGGYLAQIREKAFDFVHRV
jgi:hypothetical protein